MNPKFQVSIDHSPFVSLALQHNAVPIVHRLRLEHDGAEPLEDVRLTLQLGDNLSLVYEAHRNRWPSDEAWELSDPALLLKAQELVATLETTRSYLQLEIHRQSELLHQQHWPMEVQAYNHWPGLRSIPDLLCSFVLPQHPGVSEVLRLAGKRVSSLDGYQTGHALEQCRAIYQAVQELQIGYLQGNTDWAEVGQRVRTPDQLLEHRQGNCLDITLLMAAALRQAGLHPLLVLVEGHAFPGCWLRPEDDPDGPLSDESSIDKCLALGLLCIFNSSSACGPSSFEEAEKAAQEYLPKFQLALDLRASERQGIRPLPLRLTSGGEVVLLPESEQAPSSYVPKEFAPSAHGQRQPKETWEKRLGTWKNRLLDLSTRNRLLDVRKESNRKLLPMLCKPQSLLDDLLAGKTVTLVGRPRLLSENDPRSRQLAELQAGLDVVAREVADNLSQGRLQVDLEESEVIDRAIDLFRADRVNLEETGSSTLFLALGTLIWTETEKATVKRRAPVALLPVELVRVRVRDPYKLRWRGDDLRLNLTLLRKLQADFQIDLSDLEHWPADGDSDSTQLAPLLQRLRSEVLNQSGWNLEEDCYLGSFSFSKLLMLQDLERFPDLQKDSPRLRDFLQGTAAVEPKLVGPTEVDALMSIEQSRCVLDADSSQLAAVYSSMGGSSFVLQGPPGTGKSQTIANMIAQNISQGRSVLFVAEKLAALEVVYRRLQKCGLGPFCLQLHSNKASKAEVLAQLKESLETRGQLQAAPESLQDTLLELNAHVSDLHAPQPMGLSKYEAIGRLSQLPIPPAIECSIPKDFADCSRVTALAQELKLRAKETGPLPDHPWRGCRLNHWNSEIRERLVRLIGDGKILLNEWLEHCQQGRQSWALERPPAPQELASLHRLVQLVVDSPIPLDAMLNQNPWSEVRAPLDLAVNRLTSRQERWSKLEADFRESLLELDLQSLQQSFQKWSKLFLLSWLMLWGSRRRLKKVAKRQLRQSALLVEQLQLAIEVRQLDAQLLEQQAQLSSLLGTRWNGPHTAPTLVKNLADWSQSFRQHWRDWKDGGSLSEFGQRLREACNQEERLQGASGDWLRNYLKLSSRLQDWLNAIQSELQLKANFDWPAWQQWLADRPVDRLPSWTLYQEAAQKLEGLQLQPLVTALENGQIEVQLFPDLCEAALLQNWLQAVVPHRFLGAIQSEKIARFRKLDPLWIRQAQQQLAHTLRERIPPVQEQGAKGEMAILLRELKKQRSLKAPRQLFKETGNLLNRLKPCLLMSPLSIAQYLDPANPPFDLVIFDEASQIAPWDALGALARGKQWVVVGDSRQLPPTSFFAAQSDDSEDELELGGTLESILDECQASGMPEMRLNWHYRSADERLIAFSNHQYYEDGLFTFPNAEPQHSHRGVHWMPVPEGRFGRSGSRNNRVEAEALVKHLVARLKTSNGQSFGVVTFNQSQQTLIENLLDEARTADASLEPYFSGGLEPVFVKNLENVQGDERDVIYFSVAYAPDAQGKFRMEFGPLNRQGGERRLNVAVSRARHQMWIFSSIQPEQIDLNRSNARGARDLRSFLEYARRGGVLQKSSEVEAEPLSYALSRRMEELGWQCEINVGSSSYRIDLAVLHPQKEGVYLAGIEWDGQNYASAHSGRDRDRLRAAVLGNLTWRLLRVWSIEWWRDRERLVSELHQALQDLLTAPAPEPIAEEIEVEVEPPAEEPPVANESTRMATLVGAEQVLAKGLARSGIWGPGLSPGTRKPYVEFVLEPRAFDREPHQLPKELFLELLDPLVEAEGPVTAGYLFNRLARCLGARKIGTRMRQHFQSLLDGQDLWMVEGETVWHSGVQHGLFEDFRPGPRDLNEVPMCELKLAIIHELSLAISISEAELVRSVARHFGKEKAGRERILQGVAELEQRGRCHPHQSNWVWNG